MANTQTEPDLAPATVRKPWWRALSGLDAAAALIVLIPAVLLFVDRAALPPVLAETAASFAHTLPFILFAVAVVAYLRAAGATTLLAKVFQGHESRMIFLAAVFGGLSPFCSCEVIPFVAALLAVGAPLSAVMAFWLASPLMDPAMFLVTAGTLGVDFALAKTGFAIAIGLGGGFAVKALSGSALYSDPLKEQPKSACCGCGPSPFEGTPNWRFWQEAPRRDEFTSVARDNLIFLGKWLLLAYLLQSLMIRYVPADWIANTLGGDGAWPIVMGALVGGPAYLNGYAAVPLVAGLLEQGMAPGAAMSFVIAGGVSCIPAAVAVWALVKPRVFASYIAFALIGALVAGFGWAALA
ncbi:permease [Tropicimonas sp. S265A]|uniref:permease n=1 Tax=Tropicimonas sp. S265A TaxID=3415134 RepID=UPI003C7D4B8F